MKTVINVLFVIAGLSLVAGIISRVMVLQPIGPAEGIRAQAFLRFTDTCLLAVIALGVLELLKAKS